MGTRQVKATPAIDRATLCTKVSSQARGCRCMMHLNGSMIVDILSMLILGVIGIVLDRGIDDAR